MSDISLTPKGSGALDLKPFTGKPVYLVTLSSIGKSKPEMYLTHKVDKSTNHVEFIGAKFSGSRDELSGTDLVSILSSLTKEDLVFPWSRILEVKNLSYKEKK